MSFKKKFFTIILSICLCFTPFVLSGCVGGGGSGGGSGGGGNDGGNDGGDGGGDGGEATMSEYILGVDAAHIDESGSAEVKEKYATLADNIMDELMTMYGENGHGINSTQGALITLGGIERSFDYKETFANAMSQDEWTFGKTFSTVDTETNRNLLTQNIMEKLLGIAISSSYNATLVDNYAKIINHKGLFYYENDAIAELILDKVIGTNAVATDNNKFFDLNNNNTFDYYYTITNYSDTSKMQIQQIIKNFDNTNSRAAASTKSAEWNKINFGEKFSDNFLGFMDADTFFDDNGPCYSIFDKYYKGEIIKEMRFDQKDMITYQYENPGSQLLFDKGYIQRNVFNAENDLVEKVRYSCFKNYVNNTYYIVNKVVEDLDWDVESRTSNVIGSINDYGLSAFGDESFTSGYKNFKAISMLAKKDCSVNALSMFFELDESVTEDVDMDVYATYTREVAGEQVSTRALLGSVHIIAGAYSVDGNGGADIMFDLTLTHEEGIYLPTGFNDLGINKFDLKKAEEVLLLNSALENGEYQVKPSEQYIGSTTTYVNPEADFVEINFVITTEGYSDAKFAFGFGILDIE